jgi:hypothetical protein
MKFVRRDDLGPQGIDHPVVYPFNPGGEHSLLFTKTEGRTEGLHPEGISLPLWDKKYPLGTNITSGTNFTPGSHISPLGAKLKLASICYKFFKITSF